MSSKLNNKSYNSEIENIIDVSSKTKYMTRREYFNIVIDTIGGNESIFEFYSHIYPEYLYILDANVDDKEQLMLISIYYDLGILQTRLKFSLEEMEFCHYFDVDENITLQEAVVVLQSLLQETDVYEPISLYSTRFRSLYNQAKMSGILKKEDMVYNIPIDCRITENDCKILLSRFLELERRKYIDGTECKYDKSDIKYIEYLRLRE